MKKLVFDATFGEAWVHHLCAVFRHHPRPQPTIMHLWELASEEEKDDEVWVAKLTSMGHVVISGDRGTHSVLEARLPLICKEHKITHILLSDGMHHKASGFERARAIIVLWHEIVAACDDVPGSRYQIMGTDGSFRRFALVKKS